MWPPGEHGSLYGAHPPGNYDLTAAIRRTGMDLLVAVWGGEQPHIGAAAAAQPEGSGTAGHLGFGAVLRGPQGRSAGREIALAVAPRVNSAVVVTAGIHWDHLDRGGVEQVLKNSRLLTKGILQQLAEGQRPASRQPTER